LNLLEGKLAAGVPSGLYDYIVKPDPCRAYLLYDFEPGSIVTRVKTKKETQCICLRRRCTTFSKYSVSARGPDSVGSIASDSLRAVQSGDRITVGKRFFASVQTGHGTNPASYTVGTGSFPGVKWPECGVHHPSQSSAEVEEIVQLYFCSPSGPSWPVLGWI